METVLVGRGLRRPGNTGREHWRERHAQQGRSSGCPAAFSGAALEKLIAPADQQRFPCSALRRRGGRGQASAEMPRIPQNRRKPAWVRGNAHSKVRTTLWCLNICFSNGKAGCPARIRTSIDGFRVRSLTAENQGSRASCCVHVASGKRARSIAFASRASRSVCSNKWP